MISHTFTDGTKKTILHAARSLTPAEHNYSQIEKKSSGTDFCGKKIPQDAIRASLYTPDGPQTTSSNIRLKKKVFRYIQPVDCNDGQSFYWDMISAYSTGEQRNSAWLMPYHDLSEYSQFQMTILSSRPSVSRTIVNARWQIVSGRFRWQGWKSNKKHNKIQWSKKCADFSDIHGLLTSQVRSLQLKA